jgi:site-specific recombinase XerD
MTHASLLPPDSLVTTAQVDALIRDWHAHLDLLVASGEISPATRQAYRRGWERFWRWLQAQEDIAPGPVDAGVLRHWIAGMRQAGIKPNSINVWLAGVRAFFAWGVAARTLTANPAAGVRGAKRKGTSRQHLRQSLTDGEVRRVLEMPDRSTRQGRRDYALLALKAYTGARDIELQRADLADLRTRAGRLVLYVQGKGRDEKDELIVLAHPAVEEAIHDWLAGRGESPGALFVSLSNNGLGKRLSLRSIRRIVKRAYRLAGVRGEGKTSHSLRHTAITSAIRHGVPLPKVQSMARHANINTTMIYYHEVDRVEDPAEGYVDYEGGTSRMNTPGK